MSNVIYLVTGAAGFLGSTVCRQLIMHGEKVRAFVLPGDKSAGFIPQEAEITEGDLCDINSLEKFFSVPDGMESIVLHIASIVTVAPEYDQKVMDVNVGGTRNIIDMCLKHKECRRLVYCSSTGAIPEKKDGIISEVKNFDADKVEGCYSRSKAIATQLVLDAVKNDGLNACVVHPSGILGPEDNAVGETTSTLIKIINGDMPMGIKGSFNLCDVRDLAAGTISAAENGKSGSCYILGNEEVSFEDFSRLVSKESGCKKIKLFLPAGFANIIAAILEKKAEKRGEKPLMTRFSVYNLERNNKFSSDKARKELGYTTRPYRETIRDEIRWLKSTGRIA
ncbi:MAG: NAD-dependent epimerase/dehydratase family protein [Ruminococcus sp.]|nr:NAD-dependent epimerase/dehydratase family protein [Ruminococcus sp.]